MSVDEFGFKQSSIRSRRSVKAGDAVPDGARAHLFIVACYGKLALTPALSPKERVRGSIGRTMRSIGRVRQCLEREETPPDGSQGRFRVPSPRGEGQGKGGPSLPTTMKRCAHDLLGIMGELDDLLLPYTIKISIFRMTDHDGLRERIQRVGQEFYRRQGAGQPLPVQPA